MRKAIKHHIMSVLVFRKWNRKAYSVFNSLNKIIKITSISLSYTIVLVPSNLLAQTDTIVAKNIDLDEVIVSAQKAPVVYSQLSRLVTTVNRDEIKLMPVSSINELLVHLAGVDIRQRGANGIQADISIRGGSFDQNLILLNGMNISDPQTGHHSLNLPIDLNSAERIEILEGPGSRIFGPNAFSGAINIITNHFDHNFTKASLSAGDFGLFSGNVTSAYNFKKLKQFISVSKSKSNGYAKNTDYDRYNVFYNSRYNADFGKIDFQIGHTNKEFGANSFYTPKYPDQFEHTKTSFASLKLEAGEKIKFIPSVYYRRHQDRFELFRYEPASWYTGHNYHLTDVYGANMLARFISRAGTTSIGAEIRSENILSNVLGEPMSDTLSAVGEPDGFYSKRYARTIANYYLEQSFYVGNFSISGGLLASLVTKNDDALNFYPGIEMSYRFFKSFSSYLSINKSLRLPTFTDLFYSGPNNVGNPDLKPEEAISYEWGLKYNSRVFKSDLSIFYRDASNIIAWVRNYEAAEGDKWITQNLTNVETVGYELASKINLNHFKINYISVNYAYLNQTVIANNHFNTKYSLNYLKHKFLVAINHPVIKNTSLSWGFKYQNRAGSYPKYISETQQEYDQNYDPFFLIDVKINWSYRNLNLYAEVTNLLDHDYVDYGNIEMPGRWFKLGFDVHIGY